MNLINYIRDIPDFPKKGIVFKDITPLLSNGVAYKYLIEQFYITLIDITKLLLNPKVSPLCKDFFELSEKLT